MRTIIGPRLGKFKVWHMSSANGVGIELFQFMNLLLSHFQKKDIILNIGKQDIFHIALTKPNIEGLADKIASTGGKWRTDVMELVPGSDRKFCFCEDPSGNIIEIYSHGYEQFWADAQF